MLGTNQAVFCTGVAVRTQLASLMSLQNPGATRLRWSSSLLEILAEPNGNLERQRAAASLLPLLLHTDLQEALEAVVLRHSDWRLLRALGRAFRERGLVPPEEVTSHILAHRPTSRRKPTEAQEHVLLSRVASKSVQEAVESVGADAAYEAGADPRRVMARLQTAENPAALCVKLLADAKGGDELIYFDLMKERLRLDIGDYDALDLSMVEEVFVYGAYDSFKRRRLSPPGRSISLRSLKARS